MASSFNKVILLGNLTRDPEVRYTSGGTAVSDLTLAINNSYTDKRSNERREDTTFVDCTVWGRTAEIAGEYLSKGRAVLIEGRLQQDKWEDKETGQKRSKLKVVADSMQMVGGRGEGGSGGGGGGGGYQGNRGGGRQEVDSAPAGGNSAGQDAGRSPDQTFYDDMPDGDDGVPF